jgi:hypothetical protein
VDHASKSCGASKLVVPPASELGAAVVCSVAAVACSVAPHELVAPASVAASERLAPSTSPYILKHIYMYIYIYIYIYIYYELQECVGEVGGSYVYACLCVLGLFFSFFLAPPSVSLFIIRIYI